jgi:peptide/nickel transport system substrate-binding protein
MPIAASTSGLLAHQLSRRQLLFRLGASGAAALVGPGLLSACTGDGDTGAEPSGGATGSADEQIDLFTWATSGPPRSLDIATGFDGISIFCTTVGVESLVTYDDVMALQPLLAESWEQTDDTTYVYTLRDGVTFWDGSPLTADDVVASLERHTQPSSELNYYFGVVKSVKATGPLEVTVTLTQPDIFFQYIPALAGILPKAFLQEHGKDVGTPQVRTMGTGPYEIADYVADESLTWTRRDDYWGEAPVIEEFDIRFILEEATRLLAMRSGEIDGTSVAEDQIKQWQDVEGTTIQSVASMGAWYFSFDLTSEPWSDIHVRRAIAHAWDGEGLSAAVYGGGSEAATSIVTPAQWGGLASQEEIEAIYGSLTTYPFDLELARDELAQSSVPDGFEASIDYPNSYPAIGRSILNLSENLRQIGIELSVNEVSENKWITDLFAHEEPVGFQLNGIGPDYPDPANYPALCFDSKNATPNGFNTANWKDPQVDSLLEEQSTSTDPAARADAIAETLRLASEQLPFLPMFWPPAVIAVRDEFVVEGFTAVSVYSSTPEKIIAA